MVSLRATQKIIRRKHYFMRITFALRAKTNQLKYYPELGYDYNDLVFYTPRIMSPMSTNDLSWTMAYEDLGGTFDYDFNDVVFRVSHVSGDNYAMIYPKGAGGTLPETLLRQHADF